MYNIWTMAYSMIIVNGRNENQDFSYIIYKSNTKATNQPTKTIYNPFFLFFFLLSYCFILISRIKRYKQMITTTARNLNACYPISYDLLINYANLQNKKIIHSENTLYPNINHYLCHILSII